MLKSAKQVFWLSGKRYEYRFWRPKNPAHGDLATDIAFVLWKAMKDYHAAHQIHV